MRVEKVEVIDKYYSYPYEIYEFELYTTDGNKISIELTNDDLEDSYSCINAINEIFENNEYELYRMLKEESFLI